MVRFAINRRKKYKRYAYFYLPIFLILLVIGCSKSPNESSSEQEIQSITGSVIEESSENCRLSDESDCRPIEIRRGEPENEEHADNFTEDISIENKSEKNITIQNSLNLTLVCEVGWKCIVGRYIAYQEVNCSWHSLERCIYGCDENESVCRAAPMCKVNSLRCENDNLMICGEDGYRWLLNESCDKDCENNACTEDINITTLNITANATTNITNNATQNDFIADGCMSILKYNLTGNTATDEYFTLKNSCSYSIDMSSWTANDNSIWVYTFPAFNLASSGEVTVITGSGSNSQTTLYWGRGSAVWNNGGDTLYLNVSNGTNVLIKPLTP